MVITLGTPNTGTFLSDAGEKARAILCWEQTYNAQNVQLPSNFCRDWTGLSPASWRPARTRTAQGAIWDGLRPGRQKVRRTIMALAGVAIAGSALGASMTQGAKAATPTVPYKASAYIDSTNWAGYWGSPPKGKSVDGAFASFTVPKADCSKHIGTAPYMVAMWVGVGGIPQIEQKTTWLVQDGLIIQCPHGWTKEPKYFPFWEIVKPNGSKAPDTQGIQLYPTTPGGKTAVEVKPGNLISAGVVSTNKERTKWDLGVGVCPSWKEIKCPIYNKTYTLPAGAITGARAEVITEWPESHNGFYPTSWLTGGLLKVGQVRYTGADLFTWDYNDNHERVFTPIPAHKFYLNKNGQDVIYPGRIWPSRAGSTVKDSFSTFYG